MNYKITVRIAGHETPHAKDLTQADAKAEAERLTITLARHRIKARVAVIHMPTDTIISTHDAAWGGSK